MKRFLLIIFLAQSLFALSVTSRYDVNVGVFGDVGYAELKMQTDGFRYEITLKAYTTGIAATLLKNRIEIFTSRGRVVEGRYIPDIYTATKKTKKRTRVQTYYFNHEKKEVRFIEEKTKIKNKLRFKPASLEFISEEVTKNSKKEEILDNYMDNDVLSVYLNTRINARKEKFYKLFAVGAHNDKNRVALTLLQNKEQEEALKIFAKGAEEIYNLHIEPLDKDDDIVDVVIAFDKDGILKEALLGEIFWVGKITAKRVAHKIEYN